jgi:glucose/arabinose dehydrogenase
MWAMVAVVSLTLGLAAAVGDGPAPATVVISTPRSVAGVPASQGPPSEGRLPELEAALVVDGLERPTAVVAIDEGRLLVTEKRGTVRLVDDGVVMAEGFLDLSAQVPSRRVEQGLLAIATHPEFARNGRFYLHLTDRYGNSRLIEYRVDSEDPDRADPTSARLVLAVDQPGQFHNGGMIQFGPDGYLFVAMGDGGFGTKGRNAREPSNVLGAILRIDVDAADPYAAPADNPYVENGAPEVWLTGLRNPWRFSIDPALRQITVGDVGQFTWEEITVLPLDAGGLDLGWPSLEGDRCYQSEDCSTAGFTMPDIVYSHRVGCAVIAGSTYRGELVPALQGMTLYADYCSGLVRAFELFDGHLVRHRDLIEPGTYGPILSLGIDGGGEVLILTERGEIRRLQPVPG